MLAGLALLTLTAAADQYETGVRAYAGGDYQTALRIFRPLAEQGHPDAQFHLGIMYDNGLGVPRDATLAEQWYNKGVSGTRCPRPEASN